MKMRVVKPFLRDFYYNINRKRSAVIVRSFLKESAARSSIYSAFVSYAKGGELLLLLVIFIISNENSIVMEKEAKNI